jgi:hypothetical protein
MDDDLSSLTAHATEVACDLVKAAHSVGYRAGHDAGYREGYEAAVANIMKAVQGGSQTSAVPPNHASSPGPPAQAAAAPSSPTDPPPAEISGEIPRTASGRAAPGSIKALVRAFILTADRPVTENDFAARYPEVGRPSRYMAFRALDKDGAIQKQGRAWVPVPKGTGSPDAGASGQGSSPATGGAP